MSFVYSREHYAFMWVKLFRIIHCVVGVDYGMEGSGGLCNKGVYQGTSPFEIDLFFY